MAKVTNNASGPRGLYRADGALVMLEAGQSFDGDLADGALYEGLVKGGGKAPADADEPKALSAMNKAELLEAGEGIELALDADGNPIPFADATNKQMAAAIQAKRDADEDAD